MSVVVIGFDDCHAGGDYVLEKSGSAAHGPWRVYYVYLIESTRDHSRRYVGFTRDLRKRFADHNEGRSAYTNRFRPWNLVSYCAFADETTAANFERYLKSGSGKTFLKRHFLRPG